MRVVGACACSVRTCVVLEPLRIHVERGTDVEDVRVRPFPQVRDRVLRAAKTNRTRAFIS